MMGVQPRESERVAGTKRSKTARQNKYNPTKLPPVKLLKGPQGATSSYYEMDQRGVITRVVDNE